MLVGGFKGLRHVHSRRPTAALSSDVVHFDDDAGDLQSAERAILLWTESLFDCRERITV